MPSTTESALASGSQPSPKTARRLPVQATAVDWEAVALAALWLGVKVALLLTESLVMQLAGTENIRDVIAFPKASSGADPLMSAPSPVDEAQLRELGLALAPAAGAGSKVPNG